MTTNLETAGTATMMERVAGWLAAPATVQTIRLESDDWPLGAEGWVDASSMGMRP